MYELHLENIKSLKLKIIGLGYSFLFFVLSFVSLLQFHHQERKRNDRNELDKRQIDTKCINHFFNFCLNRVFLTGNHLIGPFYLGVKVTGSYTTLSRIKYQPSENTLKKSNLVCRREHSPDYLPCDWLLLDLVPISDLDKISPFLSLTLIRTKLF